jgi:hypothetical protein
MTDPMSLSDLLDRADRAINASVLLRNEARALIAVTQGLVSERCALVGGLDRTAALRRTVMQHAAPARDAGEDALDSQRRLGCGSREAASLPIVLLSRAHAASRAGFGPPEASLQTRLSPTE